MLKTIDCAVLPQIEGREPVNPISGNAGKPEPNEIDGTNASTLCDSCAFAFCKSASASRTCTLFCCARSTTVLSEICAGPTAGIASASPAAAASLRLSHLCRTCVAGLKAPDPATD